MRSVQVCWFGPHLVVEAGGDGRGVEHQHIDAQLPDLLTAGGADLTEALYLVFEPQRPRGNYRHSGLGCAHNEGRGESELRTWLC